MRTPSTSAHDDPEPAFVEFRSDLVRLASRTVGSLSEAEDVVQEMWFRWHRHHTTVHSPHGWLRTVTNNVALDRVRASKAKRESWLNHDLPAPGDVQRAFDHVEVVDDVVSGFRVVLSALSPLERTVFVLREGLDWSYSDIACVIDRSEPAVRQLNHRAKVRVASGPVRFEVSTKVLSTVAAAFVNADEYAGVERLLDALAPDVPRVLPGYKRENGRMVHQVAGVVLMSEDQFLLCRRRAELPWYPSVWDVAGCHLQFGEPPAACAMRTAREELRVSVTALRELQEFTGDDFRLTLFHAASWDGEPRNVASAQHDDVAFFTRDQASRLELADPLILSLFDRLAA